MVFGPPFPLLPHLYYCGAVRRCRSPRDFMTSYVWRTILPGGTLIEPRSRLMCPDLDLRQGLVLLTATVRGPHRCAERATNKSGPCLTLGLIVGVFYGSLLSTRKTLAELT